MWADDALTDMPKQYKNNYVDVTIPIEAVGMESNY